jgi:hypothetical protein
VGEALSGESIGREDLVIIRVQRYQGDHLSNFVTSSTYCQILYRVHSPSGTPRFSLPFPTMSPASESDLVKYLQSR